MRPKGWLISVKAPEAVWLYATVADTLEHAEVLVRNHCAVSNEKVRFERVLTNGEIERLDLKPQQSHTIRLGSWCNVRAMSALG